MSEKILAHYFHDRQYLNEDQNAIGATTSLTLRDPDLVTGDESFVRKFGNDYLITEVTDIEDPGDPNMTFRIYALDGTLLGTMPDGGPFVPGATLAVAQPCYMEIEADGGNVVVLAGIDVETDVDTAPSLTFVCAAETIQDGDTLRLYLSDTASTYYDADYMYGGARHVPIATNERRPFFTITAGLAACAVPVDGVEVQDSETYDEEFVAENRVVAVLGQTPTVTRGAGARVTREVSTQYNNLTAIYFNETGDDADAGTWQEPKLTISAANVAKTTEDVVYGGTGATATAVYNETVAMNTSFTLESDYGYMPTLQTGATIITMGAATINIVKGFILEGAQGTNVGIFCINPTAAKTITDCTIRNCTSGNIAIQAVLSTTITIDRCDISGSLIGLSLGTHQNTHAMTFNIRKNYIHSNTKGMEIGVTPTVGIVTTLTANIGNNVIYDNTIGFRNSKGAGNGTYNFNGNFYNNTFYNNSTYAYLGENAGGAAVVNGVNTRNLIIKNSQTTGFYSDDAITITYCNFDDNAIDYNGNVTSNNEISGDPKLCKLTIPYKFGLSADSPCYRADAGGLNTGALLRVIEINASDIIINGLIIDGQSTYNSAIFIADGVNHTGLIVRYNNIKNFNGIQLDPYDDDADTECIITNNKIYNGGNGMRLSRGGNVVENNLIYNNTIFNVWTDYIGQSFIHNVFYGSQYGLYLESNSSGITYRDNISHGNSLNGIYSEVSITITYCCITDATYNVSVSETTPASRFNFTDDPNLINTNPDEEDFHIKTIEEGYIVNSPCKESASDGEDVGAYDVTRSITDDSWKKYSFFDNPMNLDDILEGKGVIKQDDALGVTELWMRSNKIQLPFRWGANQASNAEQRKKVRYFTQLVRSRENSLTLEQCKVRVHLLPITKLETGTAATVDATEKTISDTDKSWVENEHKGIHLAVIFTSGSGIVIDATAKTATKAGAGWTVNAWAGYTLYHNYDFYYIVSNTATELTLSDPNSTLEDETTTYSIELYFKICANSLNQIVVLDPDDELISGSYNYYIDFVEVRCTRARHQPKQAGYNPEHWAVGKTGYRWDTEEI